MNVPLIRSQLRGNELLDSVRIYRQGRKLHVLISYPMPNRTYYYHTCYRGFYAVEKFIYILSEKITDKTLDELFFQSYFASLLKHKIINFYLNFQGNSSN
jgi:hypothetical protein